MDLAALERTLHDALSGRAEVLEGYLFGSQARGDASSRSDVDVAVFLDEPRRPESPYGYEAGLGADLMAALRVSRVDVVVLNRAPPLLYHRVLRDGLRVLSRDLQATTVREGQALSRYFDYLPQIAKFDAALHERLTSGEFGK